jgi:Na+/pantothenate symporter
LGLGLDPAYVLCLLVFGLVVVAYTTYGGFRAVVWTDVLQGFLWSLIWWLNSKRAARFYKL